MVTFSNLDIAIMIAFLLLIISVGLISGRRQKQGSEEYLLSGRKVGLFLFVLTNVATWYGGILGVGEFTYRYGLLSWFTQGFPYYIFAVLFALFFAKKIRGASLFTIPDKLGQVYGKKVELISAVLVFLLVSPAPYLLMIGSLISLVFGIDLFFSILIGTVVASIYLFKGGYKSYLITDAIQFFLMFIGFIVIVYTASANFGGMEFLSQNLPSAHLTLTGNASSGYVAVWFFIALWTFADPGFHQRSYAARTGNIARNGILISVLFWILFDFLTTSTGLFSRAILGDVENPVLAFPLLAERILAPGWKGIFYVALSATIISTLNAHFFLSATTFGRDLVFKISKKNDETKVVLYTKIGLVLSAVISIIIAFILQSVIEIWYVLGGIIIPGLIFLIIGAYYPKFYVTEKIAAIEIISASLISFLWMLLRYSYPSVIFLQVIEPMIAGLIIGGVIHLYGIYSRR